MTLNAVSDWWAAFATWEKLGPWMWAVLIIVIGFLLGRVLSGTASRLAQRTGSEHLSSVTKRLVFYAVLLVAMFAALGQLGIKPGTLLTTAGLLTVAIGFAAQTSVANVISGVFLLIDRPFSIGDMVKLETTTGIVTGIDLLSTKVRTFDNLVVRFPNEAMLKATITNYSLHDVRRMEQLISVAYDTDLEHAVEVIRESLRAHEMILDEPEPFVLVDQLGDSGVVIIVRAWCLRADYVIARSELTLALKRDIQDAGIEIPFPQRVVHTRQAPLDR